MSLANGKIGNNEINCYDAYNVGIVTVNSMVGLTFDNFKIKRANRVLPLLSVKSSIKLHDYSIPIDHLLLFQRINLNKKFQENIHECLQFELSPYPLALFDEIAMYGAPKHEDSIDNYRFLTFAKLTRNNKPVKLSSLPPTTNAAQQHLLRVYYQLQVWLGNTLNPEQWGWAMNDNILEPVTALLTPALGELLNMIFYDIDDPYEYEGINPLDCLAEENDADEHQNNEEQNILMQDMPSYNDE
ncbi:Uncharacterized protein FWK35_00023697 [Aphis craccivora]|uniref:Uncharacterized protein n=1 Tax=Aphis craccivora TaxID=307492 RepID=A0A6G0XC70_APHCR|nr:Uncharacterized protein FWK35_00023697 [Aphis craccivora]